VRAFFAGLILMLAPAAAATLTVHVGNIDPKGGVLRLALYAEQSWTVDDAEPVASADVTAVAPNTTVTIRDIKPGVYGIKTYQDVNNNGKFDQNFIGLPLERFGFSRDAKPFLSAPGFAKVKFPVVDGDNAISLHLQ